MTKKTFKLVLYIFIMVGLLMIVMYARRVSSNKPKIYASKDLCEAITKTKCIRNEDTGWQSEAQLDQTSN
jgi:hypothetical protein